MNQRDRINKKNAAREWRAVAGEVRRHFLEEFRQARIAAQNDAEAFDQVLFVIERLGSFRLAEVSALGDYEASLMDLAGEGALGTDISPLQSAWHSDKRVLFRMVKDARNDALHQGAKARYLTQHTIELALLFEDALMNGNEPVIKIGDLMVRSPMTAETWQPVSLARKTLLANSFSYLPIKIDDKWKMLSDVQLVAFLRRGSPSNDERKKRLATSLETAAAEGLILETAVTMRETTPVVTIGDTTAGYPILVIDGKDNLVGIVTAFDLL